MKYILAALVAFNIGFWGALGLSSLAGDSPRQCETFAVGVQDPHGMVYVGYVDLCGENLEWGQVTGPMSKAKEEGKWQ